MRARAEFDVAAVAAGDVAGDGKAEAGAGDVLIAKGPEESIPYFKDLCDGTLREF